jgi:hypothetical protein
MLDDAFTPLPTTSEAGRRTLVAMGRAQWRTWIWRFVG